MAFTYSGNPKSSARDEIRFQLGDIDPEDPLLQDEELDYCMAGASTKYGILALAAEAIANRMAKEADVKVGPLNLQLTQRAQTWAEKAEGYRRKATSLKAPVAPFMSDSNKGESYFKTGMHDR
jgi:hypothetical protein